MKPDGEYTSGNQFVTNEQTDIDHQPDLKGGKDEVNLKKIKYHPTGPNSNSFVPSVLGYASLPTNYPDVNAPGVGVKLL